MDNGMAIRSLRSGKIETLDAIMNEMSAYLYTVAKNMSSQTLAKEDLEEIVSDAFIRLWNSRESLNEDQSLKWYLIQITRNLTIDRLRRCKTVCLPLIEEIESSSEPLSADMEKKELLDTLNHHLNGIPPGDRDILVRFYYYNEKTSDIAKALGIKEGALRTRLTRLRRNLKKSMEREGEGYEQ